MKSFLKSLLAVIVGNLVVGVVLIVFAFVLFVGVFVTAFFEGSSQTPAATPDKAFLVLDMDMTISDTPEQHAGALRSLMGDEPQRMGLWDLTSALHDAARDRKVRGLFITGDLGSANYGSGFGALGEVRRAIEHFKKSGKPVIAHLDAPSLKNYYVASTADQLYLHPCAQLGLRGLASQSPYFADALAKYGIGVQTTKVGKYKSAVEPFISNRMSDADREQRQELLNGIWTDIVADIAASRKTTPEDIKRLADAPIVLDARRAVKAGLADKEAYLDEVLEVLKGLGAESRSHGSFAQVGIRDYALQRQQKRSGRNKPVIAVIYAEGDIVDGRGVASEALNGNALAALLRQIRREEEVAAVVLRVNSPGGSAFASEVIQREVRQLRASGRPVVISMGSLAASGGYWISTFGDAIFAEKTTITGSIGVFGLMVNVRDVAQNIGVNFDGVKTSRYADLHTITRPKTVDELALLQRHTDRIYDDFLDKVSEGRKLPRPVVAEIAEGRAWSGAKALQLGLVDSLGGLREAIQDAAMRAKVPNHVVRQFPERRTAWEVIAENFQNPETTPPVIRALVPQGSVPVPRAMRQLQQMTALVEKLNDRYGVHARLPYWVEEN